LSDFKTETFEAGQFICKIGDQATHLYFLQQGTVELVSASGDAFAVIPVGQSFGEAAILKGGIRAASIRAQTDTVCKVIGNDQARELMIGYSPLLVVIMEGLLLQQAMANAIKYLK
jgi:CRP-like cAMP-binding protein